MKAFMKNRRFIIGCVIFGVIFVMAIVGLFYTPYDTELMQSDIKNAGPSLSHIFGCDNFGRDIFSRVQKGIGSTCFISFATVTIGTLVGTLVGAITGYYGGFLDNMLMRVNDVLFAFPSVLLALVFIALFGTGNLNLCFALGVAFVPSFARMIRAEFIKQKNLDYVQAAKLMGASGPRIMFVHILPNTLQTLIPSIIIGFNNAVLAEAGLSYLGIGVQPPNPSLGRMLSDAQSYLFTNPGYAIFPGIVIACLVLGLSLIANGISEGV